MNELIQTPDPQYLKVDYTDASNKEVLDVFQYVILELNKIVFSKNTIIYLNDARELKLIYSTSIENTFLELAHYSFNTSNNLFLKIGDMDPLTHQPILQNCIVCVIPDSKPGNDPIGVLILDNVDNTGIFPGDRLKIVSHYCERLSIILQNSIFYKDLNLICLDIISSLYLFKDSAQTNKENARLEVLLKEILRVTRIINSSHHLTTLLRQLMESVKSVFKTESCSILLVDKEKNDLYFHIIAGEKEEEISKIRVPMGKGIAGTVAVTREPMIINDAQNDNRVYKAADKTSGFTTRNILAAPLVVDDEVIGVMEGINTIGRDAFDDGDINLFLTFSDAAAVAIQKARLVDNLQKANKELEKKVSELESLFDLGQAVLESKNVDDLILRSIKIILTELDAYRALIIIKDLDKHKFHLTSYINSIEKRYTTDSLKNSIIIHSIIDNKIILKKESSPNQLVNELDAEFLVGSYIILPLKDSDGNPFGAICVSERKEDSPFTNSHLRLLQTISSQFTKGYENIKLNERIILQKAMEKEIQITRDIQKHILPDVKNLPVSSNFQIGIKSEPAGKVSGDFYDFYKYEDGQYSFLIADVSGKSLPAAIFMAMSSSVMRILSRGHKLSPAELLKEANVPIYEDSKSGMFVTLFFIHYNPAISEIEFASAGHNDQVWIKGDGSYEYIKGKGMPLGVVGSAQFTGGKFTISPGDMIVLYTDGAIEEKNQLNEEFGLERFVEEIIKRKEKHPKEIVEEVYKEIMSFSNSANQFDDFTVLILKFNDDFQFFRSFPASPSQIPKLRDFVSDTIKVKNLDEYLRDDILLCCDEAATNIVLHSYKESNTKNPTFDCYVKFTDEKMVILLKDRGKSFDRSRVLKPSLEANIKGERKGGFGIYLMEKLMDKVTYQQEKGENCLYIEKKLK